jgi:hypothetical protein
MPACYFLGVAFVRDDDPGNNSQSLVYNVSWEGNFVPYNFSLTHLANKANFRPSGGVWTQARPINWQTAMLGYLHEWVANYYQDSMPTDGGRVGSYDNHGKLLKDTNYELECSTDFYAYNVGQFFYQERRTAPVQTFKSRADIPIANAPALVSKDRYNVTVDLSFNAKLVQSTCFAQLYYTVNGGGWTAHPTTLFGNGYNVITAQLTISGLPAGATVLMHLDVYRTTANDTHVTSSDVVVVTDPEPPPPPPNVPPVATTGSATSVGVTGAAVSGTITPNDAATFNNTFQYSTDPGLAGAVTVAAAPANASGAINANLTGLTQTTNYYFRAVCAYTLLAGGGGTTYGAIVSFRTLASAEAARIMPSNYFFRRLKNTAGQKIEFALEVPSAQNSDRFLDDVAPFAAGDVLVKLDDAPYVPATLPTRTGPKTYTWAPSQAETNADRISVLVAKVGAATWRDIIIQIETRTLGGIVGDVTGSLSGNVGGTVGGNVTGSVGSVVGNVGGRVIGQAIREGNLQSAAGAACVLDVGASALDNYYNNAVLVMRSGAGAGQQRTILDYTGATKTCVLDSAWITPPGVDAYSIYHAPSVWDVLEGPEPAAGWAAGYSMRRIIQLIARRLFNRSVMVPDHLTVYKDNNGPDILMQRGVSDDGNEQEQEKMTS